MSRFDFTYTYELSPITLVGGIAVNMPQGSLPIVSLTEANAFQGGVFNGGQSLSVNDYFAHFKPLAGGTLIDYDIGEYPFANQNVAGNAVIAQPLKISLLMVCPAQNDSGYTTKLSILTNLVTQINRHNSSGGLYTIATPSFVYTNAILRSLRDVGSETDDKQVQTTWQWDFEQPLVTLAQVRQAQNALFNKLSSGTQVNATNGQVAWSGIQQSVGQPTSIASPSTVPAAKGATSSGVGTTLGPPF